jgi:hypothetical protein
MKAYLFLITMNDGSTRELRGIFRSDWQAIDSALSVDIQGLCRLKLKREGV